MSVIAQRKHVFGIALAALAAIWLFNAPSTHPLDIREISPADARSLAESGALVVDVRGRKEFAASHIPGAILFPLDELHGYVADKIKIAKDRPIIVYCGDGIKSGPEATAILNQVGYSEAVNLKGGLEGWRRAGLRTTSDPV